MSRTDPIVFRGPPQRLATLLPETIDETAEAEASLRGVTVHLLAILPAAPATRWRRGTLRLAASTPPGRYRGSAQVGGQELPIVAEVEPRPRLQAYPGRIVAEAGPSEEVTAEVSLVNTGNVPCSIAGRASLCLFDGDGLDHAFWKALTADPPKGKQRIDLFLDDLADSHGGLVDVRPEPGAVTVDVGERRDVRVRLRLSERIRPGRTYAGAWELDGLRLPIRITGHKVRGKRKAAK